MPNITYIPDTAARAYQLLLIENDGQGIMSPLLSLSNEKLKIHTSYALEEVGLALKQHGYDCVMTQYSRISKDELEEIERISKLSVSVPLLIVTTDDNAIYAEQALEKGATDFILVSELTSESLHHSIRNAIRLKKATLQLEHTQEKLATSQAYLESLVYNTPAAFWSTDAAGIFKEAHGKGFDIIGINPVAIIGQSVFEALNNYPRIIDRFERTLCGEVVQSVDEIKNHFFKAHYTPVYDSAGRVTGVSGFAIDITERIKHERELTEAKEVAENSVRVKEQFLANISHEIRTPMNGIIGLANVLRKTQLDSEQQKYLSAIRKSADNLMKIIDDLLDFSKIAANQFTFEEVAFDLPELVQDIVDLMDNKAREKNNLLTTAIGNNVPKHLVGDPLRLRQVILNLVSNATKFTDNGEITLQIQLCEDAADQVILEFTVEDTGIGIPSEKLEAVFESFNQGSNDTTRKYGGTGLGLTISKNIIEMQGGTIYVRSQPNIGSAFTFSIPFRKSSLSQNHTVASSISDQDTFLNRFSGLQVLLAEDNEINQLLLRTILAQWGVEADVVTNGLEAIERLFEKPYDLVLMDMQMPVIDGFEAAEKIRSSESVNANVPIIALTAHTSQDEIQKCLLSGANTHLAKPFDQNELFKLIVKLISQDGKFKGVSVNIKALKGMAGDNTSFLLEVLNMYIESTPAAVNSLYQLIEAEQLEEARTSLSELYDSISVLSAKPLQFTFEKMASALQEKNIPLLKQSAAQAVTECNELVELLQQECSKAQEE
ncbi:response regulator [Pontibacter cellulosilyticus]|uniref:Sensory/regulatory protein RpfC n=1 Tax=Pontibacter cellulosilyticus TaxID=1720253 RepID=A0A923SHV2_9BACT|nr:response regulator [Pontibacter cellulosilyticus]MBC5992139.1 response regulator [Pontibacter cellulosilyticus]